MKTVVEIEWDEPKDEHWLCPDNIAIALHAYCPNTRFKVSQPNRPVWETLSETRVQLERCQTWNYRFREALEKISADRDDWGNGCKTRSRAANIALAALKQSSEE